MKTILILGLLFTVLVSSICAEEIAVAAASDLNYALKDAAARYERKTGDKINLTFGSSGNFFSQIRSGAPYDIFFSADMDYPKKLAADGLLDPASLRTYAIGDLVLWYRRGIDMGPSRMPHDDIAAILEMPEIKRIAIANPEHAPYGRAAVAALESLGIRQKIAGKLVFGENVSQAAQFAESGNAQAALIPLALAVSSAMKAAGSYKQLPPDSYPELQQGVAIVSSSHHKKAAQAFIDYISSPEGAGILKQYGFRVPAQK